MFGNNAFMRIESYKIGDKILKRGSLIVYNIWKKPFETNIKKIIDELLLISKRVETLPKPYKDQKYIKNTGWLYGSTIIKKIKNKTYEIDRSHYLDTKKICKEERRTQINPIINKTIDNTYNILYA